jgi:hypothetical protein
MWKSKTPAIPKSKSSKTSDTLSLLAGLFVGQVEFTEECGSISDYEFRMLISLVVAAAGAFALVVHVL